MSGCSTRVNVSDEDRARVGSTRPTPGQALSGFSHLGAADNQPAPADAPFIGVKRSTNSGRGTRASTSTPSSEACEPATLSSSASWSARRTATGSATSAGPEGIMVELGEQIGCGLRREIRGFYTKSWPKLAFLCKHEAQE